MVNFANVKEAIKDSDGSMFDKFEGGTHYWMCYVDAEANRNITINPTDKRPDVVGLRVPVQIVKNADGSDSTLKWSDSLYLYDIEGLVNPKNTEKFATFLKGVGILDDLMNTFGEEIDLKADEVSQWLQLNLPGKEFLAVTATKPKKSYTNADGEFVDCTGKVDTGFNKIMPKGAGAGNDDAEPLPFD